MRIKLLASVANFRRTYRAGSLAEFPDSDAVRLIERGIAEPVRDVPVETTQAPKRGERATRRGK